MSKCPFCETALKPGAKRCHACGRNPDETLQFEPSGRTLPGSPPYQQEASVGSLESRGLLLPPKRAPTLSALADSRDFSDEGESSMARLRDDSLGISPKTRLKQPGRLQIGDVFEGYHVDVTLGEGGMGRVFRGTHQITGQIVALKVLHPHLFSDERQKARFINEAKVLATLSHPGLVPLLGFHHAYGIICIIMPFISGKTLYSVLREIGALPMEKTRYWFGEVCAALAYVHSQDIRHRDLKPANIIINDADKVLLTDFGVSRVVNSQSLTMTGMVAGTAEYLAPEQATGATKDDPRSDLYALAVLLYQMLTGQLPFQHPEPAQILLKHLNTPPPPPRTIRPEIPAAVEAVLLKALAKSPEDRQPSVEAFHVALEEAFEGAGIAKATPGTPVERDAALDDANTRLRLSGPPPASSAPPTPQQPSEKEIWGDLSEAPAKKGQRKPGRGVFLRLVMMSLLGTLFGAGLALGLWYFLRHQ
ncbi:serine/threonine protein kinase [Myxococcota bacterium]|nr:serine/threonine protein kinase [Myxococcota bacterium]MBU1429817.1 serine/threonine protein kinase [Myxococcota bacterium]MBU1899417.1 serine/threonine protein kinase [Myxococcota bacterium]